MLDRIDMILEIPREKIDNILDVGPGESSSALREKVMKARRRQEARFINTDLVANSHMSSKHIDEYIVLSDSAKAFVKQAAESLKLSPRVIHRSLKLARTIADMDDVDTIDTKHLAEALQYRNKNMFIE